MTLPFPFMTAFVAQQRWQTSFEMFEITTQSYNIPFVKFSALQNTNEMERVLHLLPERWASSSLRYFAGLSVYFSGNNLTCNDCWGYSSTIVSLFIKSMPIPRIYQHGAGRWFCAYSVTLLSGSIHFLEGGWVGRRNLYEHEWKISQPSLYIFVWIYSGPPLCCVKFRLTLPFWAGKKLMTLPWIPPAHPSKKWMLPHQMVFTAFSCRLSHQMRTNNCKRWENWVCQ